MEEIAVKLEHVSKKYCKSLKRSMLYGIRDIARNLIGLSSHSDKLRKREFWAVSDVSFEARKGETLGIVGLNGSGKTTILKMLNGIFWPDKGKIAVNGRVGALIAVGAGFHPMFTGRENIYVNGSILGMSRKEINKKFNDIIQFAEIGDFVDVPVKYYSSGMFVRLGFSVAIHCEPDILLVDEVLAVGDLAFVMKCHKKMSDFKQRGGTVIIVSHNIQAIRNICDRAVWLDEGEIKQIGEVNPICDIYEMDIMMNKKNKYNTLDNRFNFDSEVKISKVEFLDNNDQLCTEYKVGDSFKLRIYFDCKRIVKNPIFTVGIYDPVGLTLCNNYSNFDGYVFPDISGKGYVDFCIQNLAFKPSKYICSIGFKEGKLLNTLEKHEKCHEFYISGKKTNYGLTNPFPKWLLEAK